ncbi:uncharacterized protein LOC129778933 isoform X2 [Toxorhynchites rutilus septentrionalis]|uniref:uncharacterized protein LOC129778933 isoform X2 n=1 Tax=Toxorhynchites rutilus septentrionalis TaxID=329112 RepID=UPI002478991D|nr:uncharacterized protein LOC129778933 isoform X2 [Toxorhynchites rutilus septentrionalis]
MDNMIMSLEESRRTQRPYRYGMILLCVGALVNWLGLAENYSEPIRYTGVACILAGACLICTAMCCWLHTPNRNASANENDDAIHVISSTEERQCEKPPDYDSVAVAPPCYDDAIKLDPSALLHLPATFNSFSTVSTTGTTAATTSSTTTNSSSPTSPSSTTFDASNVVSRAEDHQAAPADGVSSSLPSVAIEHERHREKPPPYDAPVGVHPSTPAASSASAITVELNPVIVVPSCN